MKPINPLVVATTSEKVVLTLEVDGQLPWFDGHFPIQPILPAVAQIDWVMHYAMHYLTEGYQFSSLVQVKFQKPLLPDTRVQLSLHWHVDSHLLTFHFEHYRQQDEAERQSISQGKIRLCPIG